MIDGRVVYGQSHPEIGHTLAPCEPEDAAFDGVCAFHGSACFEGVASGPAISARWGTSAEGLPPEHPAFDLEARYLAKLCVNLTHTIAPARIILGGGVMNNTQIIGLVRKYFFEMHNAYGGLHAAQGDVEGYIVTAALMNDAGILGAYEIAKNMDVDH